jgi:hypothetical protein
LIVGDVKSGKTAVTRQILKAFCRTIGGTVKVVDLAPDIRPEDLQDKGQTQSVGGRLKVQPFTGVRYYHAQIYPSRLRARDEKEAEELAAQNLRTIETLFEKALKGKADALFINDCSLYLHAGSPAILLEWIRTCRTVVVNGYVGQFFDESSISIRESEGMEFLMRHCDRLIKLSSTTGGIT